MPHGYLARLNLAAFAACFASACAQAQEEQFAQGVVTSALETNANGSVGKV